MRKRRENDNVCTFYNIHDHYFPQLNVDKYNKSTFIIIQTIFAMKLYDCSKQKHVNRFSHFNVQFIIC